MIEIKRLESKWYVHIPDNLRYERLVLYLTKKAREELVIEDVSNILILSKKETLRLVIDYLFKYFWDFNVIF